MLQQIEMVNLQQRSKYMLNIKKVTYFGIDNDIHMQNTQYCWYLDDQGLYRNVDKMLDQPLCVKQRTTLLMGLLENDTSYKTR